MKKTLTVNIGGSVFHIEEDAYLYIDSYLKKLKKHFSNEPESDEILKDIEIRMSEIFREELKNNGEVVTLTIAEKAISMLGQPEEFDQEPQQEKKNYNDTHNQQQRGGKRFYRNPERKVIAGVCSGIATYMNIDPVLVRIIFILLLFPSGFGLAFAYLILWIIFPEAYTASQRLEMQGEPVNINNIGREVKESTSEKPGSQKKKRNSPPPIEASDAGKTFLKIITYLVGGFFLLIFFSIILAITLAFVGSDLVSSLFGIDILNTTPINGFTGIGLFLFIGSPIILIAFIITKILFRHKGKLIPMIIICFLLWIAGLALTGSGIAKTIRDKELIPSIFNSMDINGLRLNINNDSIINFNTKTKSISLNKENRSLSISHQTRFSNLDTVNIIFKNFDAIKKIDQNPKLKIDTSAHKYFKYGLTLVAKEKNIRMDKRTYDDLIFKISRSKKHLMVDYSAIENLTSDLYASEILFKIPENMIIEIEKEKALYFDQLKHQIRQSDGNNIYIKSVSDSIVIVRNN